MLATLWVAVESVLAYLPDWHGRIVIDGTNPVLLSAPDSPEAKDLTNSLPAYGNKAVDLGDTHSSSIIRDLVPGAWAPWWRHSYITSLWLFT